MSIVGLLCNVTLQWCYNKLVSKARKKWLQLSAIIYNTSNGDVRRLLLAWNQMQKIFVIHYYINKQILDSYLHTKSEKIWLLFTFVLNWVFLQFPWQRQAFWNFQASKPLIHMPSCKNVAPVTNLFLGRATTRSHSSQWKKKKLQLKHKNSLFALQTFHYNYYWWSQSLLNPFGWEIYAFQR